MCGESGKRLTLLSCGVFHASLARQMPTC